MFTINATRALYLSCLAFSFCQSKGVTTSPERMLVGHVQLLQALKERFEQSLPKILPKKAINTPTLSYIKAAKGGYLDNYYYGWSSAGYKKTAYIAISDLQLKYKDLVESVIEREKEHCNDYYVFYHGQRSKFWVFQEFLKELYSLIKIHSPISQFEFLRMWQEAADTYQVNNFIDTQEANLHNWGGTPPAWNDTTPELIKNMLCVNLSLFGNLTYSGESSFSYFSSNSNASWTAIENLFSRLFDYYGFDQKFIGQLIANDNLLDHKNGILMQIFVPKNQADDYIYLSKAYGTPVREKLDETWNASKNRHMNISSLLEKYIKEPHSMGNFDQLQARVLLSKDCMLNPDSGVKVFKYSTEAQAKLDTYQLTIKNIAKRVFIDALEKKTFKNIKFTSFGRLINYSRLA
jgi:hypothetical protein